MTLSFEADEHPGRPRILFVGPGESSHTHAWIDLLAGASLNLRLFAMPSGVPPNGWPIRTYVTAYYTDTPNSETRKRLFPSSSVGRFARRSVARFGGAHDLNEISSGWLAKVIRQWQPDLVHTFGLEQAQFYHGVRRKYGLEGIGKWVLQTRGGSDLALSHLDPELRRGIAEILKSCDQLVSDNQHNFQIARELGVREDQISRIGAVPGTGGIDVESMAAKWHGAPSSRRLILWPKSYECPWSKSLPVFEALKLCWEQIRPCKIHLLAAVPETRMWFWALPEELRASCVIEDRVPRDRALDLMAQARVMLAPSLVDGVPNSMYEAMAAGAFPIVSPLETIRPVVEHERNVLFAHNLYPQEIADALVRAMSDDEMVDAAAERNLELVRRVANRQVIKPRVIHFYEQLLGSATPSTG